MSGKYEYNITLLTGRSVYFSNSGERTMKAIITMSDGKTMSAELYPETAPVRVDNFVSVVRGGF